MVVPTLHTRQDLAETVDVLGYRGTAAVTHVRDGVATALAGLDLPPGYTLRDEGEGKAMDESFAALVAILLGLVLLYFSLVPAFRSFLHPLTIMMAIPLALEWAIGLERLSPLAAVAIGGLVVSTFLTLVYVPLIYDLFENLRSRFTHGTAPALPDAAEERG